MQPDNYIFKKLVDWSLLTAGFTIPISLHPLFQAQETLRLGQGEKRSIRVMLDGIAFSVTLQNIDFDRERYPTHQALLQIRYSHNSPFALQLQRVFFASYEDIQNKRNNSRKRMQARSDVPEYLCIYSTQIAGTLLAECISASEWREEHAALQGTEELEWENIQNLHQDPFADIIQREGTTKLRKLDRSIAFELKQLYQYRCQICGELIGEQYGSNLIHAHHIVPFTQSLNNNPENILIVCPNHHGIIHDVNPLYLREKRAFSYPNGFVEPLAINLHL